MTSILVEAVAPRRQVELFGIPVDALTLEETVQQARSMVRAGGVHRHVVVNAAKVVEADRDPVLKRHITDSDLINADGMSVVWAARVLGRPVPERVTGIDLFERLVETAAADGDSVYFLGAEQAVLDKVVDTFRARHPRLRVAGSHDGYWDDDDAVVEAVRRSRPSYLFLAIPSPRKEAWLASYAARLEVPFVMGVGGSFDVVAGKTSRAPRLVQKVGLEWGWRLLQEPRRMWKRYVFGNARFMRLTLHQYRQART